MRQWLYAQMDSASWPRTGLSPVNRAVALLIVAAVVAAILETEPEIRSRYGSIFQASDILFGLAFSLEYLTRLWIAGENPRYKGLTGRVRYAISPLALIDLLALLPFLLSAGLSDTFLLRIFRLLRLVSLAKLGRYSTALQNIFGAISERRYELVMSIFAALLVMLMAASALHFAEGDVNPDSFGSIPRALWWGVATITKVGYGGAFPLTVLGKLFAGIFALAAVGVVALPTGILAAALSDAFRREREQRVASSTVEPAN